MIEVSRHDLSMLNDQPILYAFLAGLCLLAAVRYLKHALEPIGAILGAVAAAAVVALTLTAALILTLAAVITA